ncbi:hypothetical protein J3R82DRAFT_11431 [Butyriboletus roseoflavus]|nr:hypothetical protein J3R82DRAFT_11431 [Butyriboletus roseoflavus]
MSPLRLLQRGTIRAFHSPFVASPRRTTPSSSTPASIYEKQHDSSPEPHLSSSGTRTYVVSEPDPSNTPYEVPSGAYPTSAPYLNLGASTSTPRAGESAAIKNTGVPAESDRRAGSHGGGIKQGKS